MKTSSGHLTTLVTWQQIKQRLRDLDTPVPVESQVPAVFHFVSLELIYFLQFKKNIMKATMKGGNKYNWNNAIFFFSATFLHWCYIFGVRVIILETHLLSSVNLARVADPGKSPGGGGGRGIAPFLNGNHQTKTDSLPPQDRMTTWRRKCFLYLVFNCNTYRKIMIIHRDRSCLCYKRNFWCRRRCLRPDEIHHRLLAAQVQKLPGEVSDIHTRRWRYISDRDLFTRRRGTFNKEYRGENSCPSWWSEDSGTSLQTEWGIKLRKGSC